MCLRAVLIITLLAKLFIQVHLETIPDYNVEENIKTDRSDCNGEEKEPWIEKMMKLWAGDIGRTSDVHENPSNKFWIAGQIQTQNQRVAAVPVKSKQETHKKESKESTNCCTPRPSSCADIQGFLNIRKSGIYTIYPKRRLAQSPEPIQVYCDLETNGGEWTVIQRRDDCGIPKEHFNRSWVDYKNGFGNLSCEFWLGNDIINVLSTQDDVYLRVEMTSFESEKRYAEYDSFRVKREDYKYEISLGNFRGDAGDGMASHKNAFFSTYDSDNDQYKDNCAILYKGGWWYTGCHHVNLNGIYYIGKHSAIATGVNWYQWKGHDYSYKTVEMKIRPI